MPAPSVMVGHREDANGRSGGHGFTVHIRDVYFSRYLDRSGLTLLPHFYPPFPERGEVTYDIPIKWTLPTRLRKLCISLYFPCPLTCTRNMTRVNRRLRPPLLHGYW